MIDIDNIEIEGIDSIQVSADDAEEHGVVLPEPLRITYRARFVGNETVMFTFETPENFVATITAHGGNANEISQFAANLPSAVNQALSDLFEAMDPEALAAAEEASRG